VAGPMLEGNAMMPLSYELKRIIAQHRQRFWCAAALSELPAAPVYLFPDQERFDSEEVNTLAQSVSAEPLLMPHDAVLFEVADRGPEVQAQVAFVRRFEAGLAGFLFLRRRSCKQWTDVHCHAWFCGNGVAEVEANPRVQSEEDANRFAHVLTGLIWRSLAILSQPSAVADMAFPRTRRPKLARAGISGWTWHLVDIDPSRMRAAAQKRGGTHASPRWHIRRGHWRTLGDGRQVFVRSCEVGDPARGGVVKDYRIVGEIAA
jgi:hypothetical protein